MSEKSFFYLWYLPVCILSFSILMKIRTLKTKYFPKNSIWTRAETRLQSQQKSNGNQERYGLIHQQKKSSFFFFFFLLPLTLWLILRFPLLGRTWPSAPARRRTKQEGRGNTKSQKASSPGSPTTPTLEPTSLGRSSRTTSGRTLCSTTWCVDGPVEGRGGSGVEWAANVSDSGRLCIHV